MYFALCHPSDIRDLSVEQLQYISKVVLLRVYGDYIEHIWNKLPENRRDIRWTCREHDIAYTRSNDLTDRHMADKVLADKALGRVTARDSTLSEIAATAAVWAAMKYI
ncbi:hypothetical protein ALC53_04158 [Atta colombica]|uniref:Uncharacterized protein n=1 Tax=Atta colombica TaxID=520822 RepID=A0A195BMD5_9HYME|nr:hypothetical protein ALC53_04158 [Atta colombica]